MMKRDLKSAFRHIPISPQDHWLLVFEWRGQYYVDMFLPFGLRTAPRIFNLFAEAIHWVLEQLHAWSLTHYLDDFLAVFPPKEQIAPHSATFDAVLHEMGLTKAAEKDMQGTTVIHLGFIIDSMAMEVRLPPNKAKRARHAVNLLLTAESLTFKQIDEILGFLSHCCQAIPLGRPFLRSMFSLHRCAGKRHRRARTRIPAKVKKDLRWWQVLLGEWSALSIAPRERNTFEVWTDASGKKGIGGFSDSRLFSTRVPPRHRGKHINFKEMHAVLHAFILWHSEWKHGRVLLRCNNSMVVDSIKKRSCRGLAIHPLQTILLIVAAFDIELVPTWIPTGQNVIADAASRHDYKKLISLGLTSQVNSLHRQKGIIKTSVLRQRLLSFFTTPSRRPLGAITQQA